MQAGMQPADYYNSSLETTRAVLTGYELRQVDQWKHTRYLAYITSCTVTEEKNRKELFDFMPLPGDPSPEERQAAKELITAKKKKEADALLKEQKEFNDRLRKQKNKA